MTKNRSKIFVGSVVLVALLFSAVMAFSAMGGGVTFAKGPKHHKPTPTPVHHKPTPTPKPPTSSTTDFAVPQGNDPWGTAFDSHGNVWVALPDCDLGPYCAGGTFPGKIAEFNPTNDSWTKVYSLPSGFGQPLFLAFDKSGNLWFPMPMTNTLGELVFSTNKASQWTLPTPSAGPWDLAIDGNGNIWVTEHYTNKIAEFNPSTDKFVKEVATPATNSNPYGITIDHSNNVWFTENTSSVALIAEYTTGNQLKEYKIRNTLPGGNGLTPHLITVDGSGNIWWSEGWVSSIGKLVVSQAKPGTTNGVTEYTYKLPCATCGSHTSGIAIDHSGNVWFDDSLQSIFGYFNGAFTTYSTPTANSHPHDGMNVDSSNRVWFDEEFANKLARHS